MPTIACRESQSGRHRVRDFLYFLINKNGYIGIWNFPMSQNDVTSNLVVVTQSDKFSNPNAPVFCLSKSTGNSACCDVFIDSLGTSVDKLCSNWPGVTTVVLQFSKDINTSFPPHRRIAFLILMERSCRRFYNISTC